MISSENRDDGSPATGDDADRPVSVISLANVLLRHSRLMIIVPLLLVTIAVARAALTPVEYAADSALIAQTGGGGTSRLSGLAEQFGIGISGRTGPGESTEFYAELLRSREVLQSVATADYEFNDPDSGSATVHRGTLLELYDFDATTPDGRRRQAIQRLRDDIGVSTDPVTGIIRLNTRAPWPALAVQINQRLLDLANDFNLRRRQSQARAEREFVEGRLEDAQEALRQTERAMEEFLEQNRSYAGSPQLSFEFGRLQRQVEQKQQVVISLATGYEEARIAEVRDVPLITIIESPAGSERRIASGLVIPAAVGAVLGLLLAVALAFTLDYLKFQRWTHPGDYLEFQRLGRSAVPDLRLLGRLRNARSQREKEQDASPVGKGGGTGTE